MNQDLLAAPHAHDGGSVPRLMGTVLVAVAPVTLYGVWLFGWPAFNLLGIVVLSCLVCEAGCLWLAGR